MLNEPTWEPGYYVLLSYISSRCMFPVTSFTFSANVSLYLGSSLSSSSTLESKTSEKCSHFDFIKLCNIFFFFLNGDYTSKEYICRLAAMIWYIIGLCYVLGIGSLTFFSAQNLFLIFHAIPYVHCIWKNIRNLIHTSH